MSKNLYLNIHAIQMVAPSNMNRDDAGSPKSVIINGTRRMRISSQSWKKAIRDYVDSVHTDDKYGFRTKDFRTAIEDRIHAKNPNIIITDDFKGIDGIVCDVLDENNIGKKKKDSKTGKKTCLSEASFFIGNKVLNEVADLIISKYNEINGNNDNQVLTNIDVKIKDALKSSNDHAYDIALFGRMLASDADKNIEAACQFAHAVGVSEMKTEFDFYTATDDNASNINKKNSDMMGTSEFVNGVLYRYANINFNQLSYNLGNDTSRMKECIETFIHAFIEAIPSGKQNSEPNHILPSTIIITIGSQRQYTDAFQVAITGKDENNMYAISNITELASNKLIDRINKIGSIYGSDDDRILLSSDSLSSHLDGAYIANSFNELVDESVKSFLAGKNDNED